MEKMKSDYNTIVDWPLQPHGAIQLNCSVSPGEKSFANIARDWKKKALTGFSDLLGQITYEEVTTLQEVWEQVSSISEYLILFYENQIFFINLIKN